MFGFDGVLAAGRCNGLFPIREQMDMIRDAADAFRKDSILLRNSTDGGSKVFYDIRTQDCSALLCAKDTMNV